MTLTLERLDAIAHDPAQTHLSSYAEEAKGPYPAHPWGDT